MEPDGNADPALISHGEETAQNVKLLIYQSTFQSSLMITRCPSKLKMQDSRYKQLKQAFSTGR